ncbi:MAG: hypothetical protein O3C57_04855 [Verrucomicrobia bacterium]|nr:hypothetical protein [Verrucomicrobiota bacterium]
MTGSDVYWPQILNATEALTTASTNLIWSDILARQIVHAEAIGLPLCGNLAGWTTAKSNLVAIANQPGMPQLAFDEARKLIPAIVGLSVSHYQNAIRHWRFHNAINTSSGGTAFDSRYWNLFSNAVAAIRHNAPEALIVAPGLLGADTNTLLQSGMTELLGRNDWVNLHTYSWGYITEPDLVSSPVQEALETSGRPQSIVISRCGHDRAFPGNGVLGQTQQLAKWFGFAMTQAHIKKVFFGMQAGDRWTPVDAQGGPYPAWVALRTLGLLLDGAHYIGPIADSPTTFAFRFRKADTHLMLLWHDAHRPAQIRTSHDCTFVNMMDQRYPVKANAEIPVDRLPVILVAPEAFNIFARTDTDE